MKKFILIFGVISSAAMLSSCTVSTAAYGPEYSGYTVGYGGGNIDSSYDGYDGYVGYGGWASNYYSPGYHYIFHR